MIRERIDGHGGGWAMIILQGWARFACGMCVVRMHGDGGPGQRGAGVAKWRLSWEGQLGDYTWWVVNWMLGLGDAIFIVYFLIEF